MAKNVGSIDKVTRVVIGITLIVIGVLYDNMIIAAIAIIPIGTALISWCPLYTLLGINTSCETD